MTSTKKSDAPENRTFKREGWLPIAFFVVLLIVGLIAALIIPNFR